MRERETVRRRELDRPVRQEDRPVGRGVRLLGREVAARRTVAPCVRQRRLTNEEVGAGGERRELFGWCAVP